MPERAHAKTRRVPRVPLRDVAHVGMRLRVTCSGCMRWAVVDPMPLLPRYGATPVNMLKFRSRCCNARGVPVVTAM
jgi:hypothetical protein